MCYNVAQKFHHPGKKKEQISQVYLRRAGISFLKMCGTHIKPQTQASQEASSAMLTVCGLDGVKTKKERTDLASLLAKSWYSKKHKGNQHGQT